MEASTLKELRYILSRRQMTSHVVTADSGDTWLTYSCSQQSPVAQRF